MALTLYICLGVATALLIVGLGWRVSSRRTSLPCPTWLAWLVELDNPVAKNNNARTIVRRLDLQPGMRVLDAGCGPGRLTIPIAQQIGPHGEVVAIDVQSGMLRRAQEKAHSAGVTNIQFLELAVGEGKLGRDQYDRVCMVTVLGEIPDRRAALQEVHGALKPGGILLVTEIIFDPHYQSRATVLQLASAVGFHEKSFFGNRLSFTVNLEKLENN